MQAACAATPLVNAAGPRSPLVEPLPGPKPSATVMPLPLQPLKAVAATAPGLRTHPAQPPEQPQPHSARPPLRVHVEESAAGIVVWLGIDARAQTPSLRAASVAAELRRLLAGSAQRVAAVICNGHDVEAAATFNPKEP